MALNVDEKAKKVTNPAPGSENQPKTVVPNENVEPSEPPVGETKEEKKARMKKEAAEAADRKKAQAEAEKHPKYNLKTTRPVEFVINGVKYSGNQFQVPENSLNERKADLRANYGENIISEE